MSWLRVDGTESGGENEERCLLLNIIRSTCRPSAELANEIPKRRQTPFLKRKAAAFVMLGAAGGCLVQERKTS